MQAALKFFDFPFKSAGGQGANKIGIKLPGRRSDQLCEDETGFMEILAALSRISPQELNTSLAQLDWVPVEDSAGEFAPLIDLTDQASVENAILQMLVHQQGTETQTPPLPSQIPVGQADGPIDPGKNTSVLEMIKTPTDAAAEQLSATADGQHQQAQDGPLRAVPTQKGMNIVENDDAADQNAVLPKSKGARLVLADRAAETARQSLEQSSSKPVTASVPSDPQPQRSSALEKWLANQAPVRATQLSGENHVRQAVSDLPNSAAQPFQAESPEDPILQERIQQNNRFVSTLSDRQALPAQKMSGENAAVAQEAGLQIREKAEQRPLHRAVRIDALSAMREEQFMVKPSEGAEMQMNSNASREGASLFDSQLSTNALKAADASTAAKQTTPFSPNDTQTDVIRQIVQRMTLKSNRQQSQMVIRLKPDFLGDVRLQVTTEGQQVMVRMDAESAMVKEIVEQNMAHLKAELNQHGLHVEKFDVFVGNDNDGWRSGQQQAGFRQESKRSRQPFNAAQSDDESFHHSGDFDDNHGPSAGTKSTSEVDYFV